MTTLAIVVSTYGDDRWRNLARRRAVPSAATQGANEVIVNHEPNGTVATCRNNAANTASSDYLLFLDADDELSPGYVNAVRSNVNSSPSMYAPRVEYVHMGRSEPPKFWPEKPLWEGNWLVIGTVVPRDMFLAAGGFPEAVHGFEDWALFAKLWRDGAEIVKVPEAVYRAHVVRGSRNRRMSERERLYWHQHIGHSVFPDRYQPTTADEDAAHALATKHLRFA